MLKNDKLWEYDQVANSATPVGSDSWSVNAALSSIDDFLFVVDKNSILYKVDKQTGIRTLVTNDLPSPGLLAPN